MYNEKDVVYIYNVVYNKAIILSGFDYSRLILIKKIVGGKVGPVEKQRTSVGN